MGDIHYWKDIPDRGISWSLSTLHDYATVTQEVFDRLADYSRSQPTGPSSGRVYKKNLGWHPDDEDAWYIYMCIRDPNDEKFVLHVPRKLRIGEP